MNQTGSDQSYAIGVFPTLELLTHRPDSILKVLISSKSAKNSGVDKITALCRQKSLPVETSDRLIYRISAKENSYAVGVFKKYPSRVSPDQNHLVLVGIRDMGNLGTICRTMLGFNFPNLAIIKPAADIFDPKTVRASMGAVFRINFQYFDSFRDYQQKFTRRLYPFMTTGPTPLPRVNFQPPFALIFGSEASGLDDNFQSLGTGVSIPQTDQIDSFNLSVAVAIALYAAQKQITS